MKIKIVSDLHLEFSDVDIPNDENVDVLILSGDILVARDLHDHPEPINPLVPLGSRQTAAVRYRDFLRRCGERFPHVIYIAGNHEFYNGRFHASIDWLREECARYPNIHYLEQDTVVIDDVVFVGGTLWTDMNKGDPLTQHAIRDMMSDFRVIKNDKKGFIPIKPVDAIERHIQTKEYFKHVLGNHKDQRCVVVGHHTPSHQSCHPRYANDTLMNGGYHSDLSEFIMDHPQIVLWTHGHTHHVYDYLIGTTRVVCNPRGYHADGYSEETGWDPKMFVEI
jgi:3',5'-cyclic AMP phosphodiesterase CpdA